MLSDSTYGAHCHVSWQSRYIASANQPILADPVILAIFASRLLNGHRPMIFEDGEQRRDFVHVRDVARANVLALSAPEAVPGALNVASGTPRSIGEMASALHAASTAGAPAPLTTGEYRLGDVRHVFAGADLAAERLGFRAQEPFRAGMAEFAAAALRAPPR